MPRQVETPERETLVFLTKAWSMNKRARFRWAGHNRFQCDARSQTIFITNYRDNTTFSNIIGFDRWRIWRFLTFHESMHLLLSPKMSPREFIELKMPRASFKDSLESLYRIFEDIRIEVVGLQTYVGYIPEEEFFNAVSYLNFKKGAPKSLMSLFTAWWLEFQSRILYRRSTFRMDPAWESYTTKIIADAYKIQTQEEALNLAVQVSEWITSNFPEAVPLRTSSETSLKTLYILNGSEDISPEELEPILKDLASEVQKEILEGSEDLQGEFDLLEKEIDNQKPDDADLVSDAFNHGAPTKADATAVVPTIKEEKWDDLMRGTEGIINILKSTLRRWRVGWKEVLAEEGDDLDAEAPILTRLGHAYERPKIFLDERRVGSRGKLLVLVDMSGSIEAFRESYLQAGGIIAEALSFISASFELYCFRELNPDGPTLELIKTYGEHWGTEQRERLANEPARGDTPLHNILRLIRSRAKLMRVHRLVILTDGNPDSLEMATSAVRDLTVDGVKVMFLGIRSASVEAMKTMLDYKHVTERIRYIEELSELPKAFFELLQASS